MENESQPPQPPLHDDPEIAALFAFEPVARKCVRHDGWSAENQRHFIAGLAETGSVDKAAQAVGLSSRGARQLRKEAGAEGFAAAWDKALTLHKRRRRRPGRAAPAVAPAAGDEAGVDAEAEAAMEGLLAAMLEKYWAKLSEERICRLDGRVVEADFCVRQLSWIEVALDLGGKADELLGQLRRGGHDLSAIVATPMSVLIAGVRRDYWRERGEPERPAPAELGEHDGAVALGLPHAFLGKRDGDFRQWNPRQDRIAARNAEAQKAWEEKARADAEAWRARVEGDHPQDIGVAPGGAADPERPGPKEDRGEADRGPRLRSLGP